MLSQYIPILKEVHRLAKKRHADVVSKSRRDNPSNNPLIDLADILPDDDGGDDGQLLKYLCSLDIETIKVIQTTMYLGRDYMPEDEHEPDGEEEESFSEGVTSSLQVKNPEKFFDEWMSSSAGVSGFVDKDVEIDQIDQKLPLDKYLERAFLILGIRI